MNDIPLDDLLPTNDATHIPQEDFDAMFLSGGDAWDLVDNLKWKDLFLGHFNEHFSHFKVGYYACMFDILLKSGREFMLPVPFDDQETRCAFSARARMFRREVQHVRHVTISNLIGIHVSAYRE